MKKHQVSNSYNEIRLDRYLKKILISIKQSSIEEFIRKKKIGVEGVNEKITSGFRIKNNDVLLICEDIYEKYQNLQFIQIQEKKQYKANNQIRDLFKRAILFENENFVVLNKPVNFSCQGGNNIVHSIDEIMRSIYGEEIRIVHRLDRKTSGILLMAKNLQYSQLLTKFFKEKFIEKTYYAICENNEEKNDEKNKILNNKKIIINKPLRSRYILSEDKVVIDYDDGDEAISNIELVKKMHSNLLLLKINPKTGRKHQIRVHLTSIGLPILGDAKYNSKQSHYKNMFLHAGEIKINQKDLKFEIKCELPKYFVDFFD